MHGVEYLHAQNIVHADIKVENVLFKGEGEEEYAKLTDFGLSFYLEPGKKREHDPNAPRGTPEYFAPELARKEPIDEGVDLWAAGILLYVTLGGTYPFHGKNAVETAEQVLKAQLVFPSTSFKGVSNAAQSLIKKLLNPDSSLRPRASEVLKDSWFQGGLFRRHRGKA